MEFNSAKNLPPTIKERLRKIDVRHFDELIHDQDKDWLINIAENFN